MRVGMLLQWYNTQRAFGSRRCLRARRYRRGGGTGRSHDERLIWMRDPSSKGAIAAIICPTAETAAGVYRVYTIIYIYMYIYMWSGSR